MSSLLLLTILLMRKQRFKEVLWCTQYYIAKKLINLVLVTLCPLCRWRNWWIQAWEIKWLPQGKTCGWEVVWSLFLISNAEFFPWFDALRQKQNLTLLITLLEAGLDLSWSTVLHCFLKSGPGFPHSGIKPECVLKCIFLGPVPVFESNALTTRSGICIWNKHPRKGLYAHWSLRTMSQASLPNAWYILIQERTRQLLKEQCFKFFNPSSFYIYEVHFHPLNQRSKTGSLVSFFCQLFSLPNPTPHLGFCKESSQRAWIQILAPAVPRTYSGSQLPQKPNGIVIVHSSQVHWSVKVWNTLTNRKRIEECLAESKYSVKVSCQYQNAVV